MRPTGGVLTEEAAGTILNLSKIRAKLEAYKDKLPKDNDFEVIKLLYSVLLVKLLQVN
jgi:hypothetical protein